VNESQGRSRKDNEGQEESRKIKESQEKSRKLLPGLQDTVAIFSQRIFSPADFSASGFFRQHSKQAEIMPE